MNIRRLHTHLRKQLLWGILCLGLSPALQAQSVSTYSFATNTTSSLDADLRGSVVDMSAGTTLLVGADLDDERSAVQAIGFPLTFAGSTYTQFSANSNGIIRLGATRIGGAIYSTNSATSTAPYIAPMAGDLRTGAGGKVHVKLIGTAPLRTLVIEFLNMSLDYVASPGSNDGTFQVRLYETSNIIEFVYGSMHRNASATDSPLETFNIGIAAGTTSPNRIGIDTSNTLNTTGGLIVNNYVSNADMAKVHSTANGSRRAYIFSPPTCTGTPVAGTPALSGITACSATGINIAVTGGTLTSGISFRWESSTDSLNWLPLLPADTLAAYTGPAQATKTYFRRVSTCNASSLFAATAGLAVNPLQGGATQSTAAICGDSITLSLSNASATTSYQWESSTDSLNWTLIQTTSANTLKTISPTANNFYRAVLFCSLTSASTSSVPVKVIPVVGGTTTISSNFCNDSTLLTVTGSSAGPALVYSWEESGDSLNWTSIPGANAATYKFRQPATFMFYRRSTTCGANMMTSIAVKVSNTCNGFSSYSVTRNTNITFTSIQSTGTAFTWNNTSGDDDFSKPVLFPAGFSFTHSGVVWPAFYVSTNGFMSLDTTNMMSALTNDFAATAPKAIIAPFWEDLVTLGNSNANKSYISYSITGTAPNRIVTVEWAEMERFQYASPNLNFQVKLYEGSNNIEFVYGNMQPFDGSGTGTFSYSTGFTGNATDNGQRLVLGLENSSNFRVASLNDNLSIAPACYSSYLFIAGGVFAPTTTSAVPANDSSAAPTLLAVNAVPCASGCGTYYSTRNATPSRMGPAPLTTNPDDDVWFKFTAPASGQVNINVFGSSDFNPAMQVMTTAFDSSGLGAAWFKNANTNALEQLTISGLAPSTDYLVRLFHAGAGSGSASGAFSICINEVIPPPANDEAIQAIALTPSLTCTAVAGTTLGASASAQPVCGGIADDDVWYKFIPNNATDTIVVTGTGTFRPHVEVLTNQLVSRACQNATVNAGTVQLTMNGLLPDSTYFVRIYHTNAGAASAGFTVCVKGTPAVLATISTTDVRYINHTGATVLSTIGSAGGFPVTKSGVLISTTPNATLLTPGIIDSASNPTATSGTYTLRVNGLFASTLYYARAYAITGAGTAYGNDISFVTAASATAPFLSLQAPSGIKERSATLTATINHDGGLPVAASGIVYSTVPDPFLFGPGVVDSFTNPVATSGSYSITPTGLLPNTKYYYKAYASNGAGTGYTVQDSFTTLPIISAFPYLQNFDLPGTGWTSAANGGANNWVLGTPAKPIITAAFSAPNAWVTKTTGNYSTGHNAGVVSPQFDFTTFTANPVLRFKHKFATESACCDGGWLEISVNNGAWTKVENVLGTGSNFNTPNATAWYNYAIGAGNSWNGSSTLFSSNAGGWITTTVPLPGAAGQANVKFRFIFLSDGSNENDGWAIDDVEIFPASAPSVETQAYTNLTTSAVRASGRITGNGNAQITASGIVIANTPLPVRGASGVIDSASNPVIATGNFAVDINGLTSSTTYYYRAYAINGAGITYGADSSFITPAMATLATITSTRAANFTDTSAILGGNITINGGSPVFRSGVVYGTLPNPVIGGTGVTDSTTSPVATTGAFSITAGGLVQYTKYYYRAYAINAIGTVYSTEDSFTTNPVISALPYVQQFDVAGNTGWTSNGLTPANINNWVLGTPAKPFIGTAYSAPNAWVTKINGSYATNHNAALVSPRFNLTGLTTDPVLRFKHKFLTENSCCDGGWVEVSINSGPWVRIENTLGTGTNFNTSNATGWYNYAIGAGNAWNGSSSGFSSATNGWLNSQVVLGGVSGNSNVRIRFVFFADGSTETEGWAIDDIEMLIPVAPTMLTGTHSGMTPTSAILNGIIVADGDRQITTSGIVLSAFPAPVAGAPGVTDLTTSPVTTGGSYSINFGSLTPGATYYYRSYATNAIGTTYGADSSFTTPATAIVPTVATGTTSGIGITSATASASVLANGGAAITKSGIVYSLNRNPQIGTPGTVDSATTPLVASGNYSLTLAGLLPGTLYYYRGYAINSIGTGYGQTDSFLTDPLIASLPYAQDFESPINTGWKSNAIAGAAQWEKGTPSKPFINGAHSGTNTWVTKLNSNYNASVNSELVSPQFDFSTITEDPVLLFYHKFFTEAGYDGMIVEISVNGGPYTLINGTLGSGINYNTSQSYAWYNNGSGNGPIVSNKFSSIVSNGVTLNSAQIYPNQVNGWTQSATCLSGTAGQNNVRFRFRFASDSGGDADGCAVDDIEVVAIAAPTLASNTVSAVAADTSATVSWTNGNGTGRIVVARLSTDAAVAPTNYTLYRNTNTVGDGDSTGTGNYVVYNGTASSATIGKLRRNTSYTFDVYEYNGKYMHVKFAAPASTNTTTTPVKLIAFTAINNTGNGDLTWATSGEKNNAGFEVERSTDGKHFEFIAFVKGAGNANSALRYAYSDEQVFKRTGAQKVYYRLKQTDHDGRFEYSRVIPVSDSDAPGFALKAFPVPFVKDVTIRIWCGEQQSGVMQVTDIQGRILSTTAIEIARGESQLTLSSMNELNAGVYFVKVTQNNHSQVVRVIKTNQE